VILGRSAPFCSVFVRRRCESSSGVPGLLAGEDSAWRSLRIGDPGARPPSPPSTKISCTAIRTTPKPGGREFCLSFLESIELLPSEHSYSSTAIFHGIMAECSPESVKLPSDKSFFLFGRRGTGKSTLRRKAFPSAFTLDLLDFAVYAELLAHPDRLEALALPRKPDRIVIDEVQRLPALLDEVHRLIEKRRWRFALTGSGARKLRRGGANLLGGRARTLTIDCARTRK
jgi:hypothetical protein